jgi:hypothetical protein
MFSPAKAITAAALVFGIGGVMLVAQPFGQGDVSPPGAEGAIDPCNTPVAPATGFIRWGSEQTGTEAFVSETGEHVRDSFWISRMDMEDDRLDGVNDSVVDHDFSLGDGGPARDSFGPFDPARAGIMRGTFRIENEGGSWAGDFTGAGESMFSWQAVASLTGAGDYEGLSATLFLTSSREPAAPVVGSIYPTDIASCEFTAAE